MLQKTPDRAFFEQIRVVLSHQGQPLRRLLSNQGQIKRREAVLNLDRLQLQRGNPDRLARRARLQHKHHLKDRRVTRAPHRVQLVNQLFERQLLMQVRLQRGFAHLAKQVDELLLSVNPAPDGQGVDEKADQRLDFRTGPVCDWRSNDQVVLARVAVQQHVERRQEQHEQRSVFLTGKLLESASQIGRQTVVQVCTRERLDGRPWLIRGQFQDLGCPRQFLPPVVHFFSQVFPAEPLTLPVRVVRVLNRQIRQIRLFPVDETVVEGSHLANHHAGGPAVRDRVVQREKGHVVVVSQLQDRNPNQRIPGQVETGGRLPSGKLLNRFLLLFFRQPGKIDKRNFELKMVTNNLDGLAALKDKVRAQHLVTLHHAVDASAQSVHVQLPSQAYSRRNVVERAARVELVQYPQALLRKRKRQIPVARHRLDGRRFGAALLAEKLLNPGSQFARGCVLEHFAQGQIQPKRTFHATGKLCGEERMPAELEKVVIGTDLLESEYFGENLAKQFFRGRTRRHVLRLRSGLDFRRRQSAAINFAVRRERKRIEQDEGSRNHVLRQFRANPVA